MHENIKVNINCAIKKKPKTNQNIENISWIPCYSCSPISSFPFHIPALWSVVFFHGTCLIHSNYSPQTKPVKKFPSEGFFTEKYRNTEPGRFHRGTLFSTNFHKMPACLVPSQLLGLLQRSLTMQMTMESWALQGVQTPKVRSPRSLHLCLKCLFQMTALAEGGREATVLKADIWDVLSRFSTTAHCTLRWQFYTCRVPARHTQSKVCQLLGLHFFVLFGVIFLKIKPE